MIWTIVSRDNYAVGTIRLGLQMLRCGALAPGAPSQRHTARSPADAVQDILFHGTAVWPSAPRARVYLLACPDLERMAIAALDGDWDRDTWQLDGMPFRYTLRDLRVIDARI